MRLYALRARWADFSIASFALKALLAAGLFAAASAQANAPAPIHYDVFRNGDRIGHHKLSFEANGDQLIVQVDIKLRVGLGNLLTFYRYEHEGVEVWEKGRLISVKSRTNNDGYQERLDAVATANGFQIKGSSAEKTLPNPPIPTSYWNGLLVQQAALLDSQNGRMLNVSIAPKAEEKLQIGGQTVSTRRYAIDGELRKDIWYNARGQWVKSRFLGPDGSTIEYRLRPESLQAAVQP